MTAAAKRLSKLAKDVRSFDKTVVKAVADTAAKALEKQIAADTGGDSRMSNFKSKATINVKRQPLGENGVRLSPKPAGMVTILEQGAKAHEIIPKLGKISGRGAKRARKQRDLNVAFGARGAFSGVKPLKVGSGKDDFAYRVKIPHTRGKKTWSKGAEKGVTDGRKTARDEFRKVVNGG